jgi:hypothetical protein
MTSFDRSKSWEDGDPIFYYEFLRGTTYWRYNSSDITRERNGDGLAWLSANISHGDLQRGIERNKMTLDITAPIDLAVVDNWRPYPPGDTIGLTIYESHDGESDSIVCWIGRIVSAPFTATEVVFSGEPTTTTAAKAGLAECWQRGCMKALYKQGHGLCNADKESKKVEGVLDSKVGKVITVSEFSVYATGSKLAGGYVEWTNAEGFIERRTIVAQSGAAATMFYGADIPLGTMMTAYAGCRHDATDCNDFHANMPNYGGDLYSPERSPFNGNPVF